MKRFVGLISVLALSSAAAVACQDEDAPRVAPATKPDAGPSNAQKLDAEAPGDAGDARDATDATDATDAPSDDAGPPIAFQPNPGRFAMLMGTSANRHKSELTVVSFATVDYVGRYPSTSIDTVPFASGKKAFLAQRDLGQVLVMDSAAPWQARATLTLTGGNDVSAIAANDNTRAFVTRLSSNTVLAFDTVLGENTGGIDLSPYSAAADTDGIVGASAAVFDSATKRLYVLLNRVLQAETPARDDARECLPTGGAIVAIDTNTNTVVDLNGAAAGEAIQLKGASPQALSADFVHGRLLVVQNGCWIDNGTPHDPDGAVDDWAGARQARGVEEINLAAATTSWLYQSAGTLGLFGLIYADATHALLNVDGSWHPWSPTETTLGPFIPSFPKAPLYDGIGHVIGLADAPTSLDTTLLKVVSYDVRTGAMRTVIPTEPFVGPRPSTELLVTSAVVR